MEQELIIATELNQLPEILSANKSLSERAVAGMKIELPAISNSLDVIVGDETETRVSDLRTRASEAIKMNKERRMPFTKRMDEVKSMFTAAENAIQAESDRLKAWADQWNGEKARRATELQKENEAKLAHENAKVDYAAHVVQCIEKQYHINYADVVARMNSKFYAQAIPEIDFYGEGLKAWAPTFQPFEYWVDKHPRLTEDEMKPIKSEAEQAHLPVMQKDWQERLTAERDRLISLIPARKSELERIAQDANAAAETEVRIKAEAAERAEQLAKQEAERAAAAESEANVLKMQNAFEQAAVQPAVQVSAGTVQKKKYAPTSHKEFIPLIQWWVANSMALMTVDDLTKKLSFVLTAANKALNNGTAIEGVPVADDFSTRAGRKK